ncbi:Hypothetical predicted protein [Scomber scombrus]|uniref:Uncharacterized protein n=1 Tax=Scomber scombrus TaxID=13677 RepID=A0AAV1PUG4_SCOSC
MVASLKQWELQSLSQLARGRQCEANVSLPTATERERDEETDRGEWRERQRGVDRWREKDGRVEKERHGRRWTSDSRIREAEPDCLTSTTLQALKSFNNRQVLLRYHVC